MHPDMSPDYDDSSSSCHSSSGRDTPVCSQQSPGARSSSSTADSTKDHCAETGAPAGSPSPFVPTLTAISSSPDLQWMVQPTVLTSVSPSSGPANPGKAHGADQSSSASGNNKGKHTNRKGQKKQASSEEDGRRQIRRERNKIAAAKCRNKRRELTDTLQAETDQLEDDKTALQTEIADLLKEKERLEEILASHKPTCKLSGEEDDIEDMLQDPPASPQMLSMLENSKLVDDSTVEEGPSLQDMDAVPSISATAILGNSNILLCSSAKEEPMEDLRGDDLEDLVPSLELTAAPESAASVPDIDLGGPFCLSDWETLYKSVANDLDPLGTPIVSSSPTCSSYRSMFSFSCSEIDTLGEAFPEGFKASRPEFMKGSLNSPTLLAL